jgi:hypothetical protein
MLQVILNSLKHQSNRIRKFESPLQVPEAGSILFSPSKYIKASRERILEEIP